MSGERLERVKRGKKRVPRRGTARARRYSASTVGYVWRESKTLVAGAEKTRRQDGK